MDTEALQSQKLELSNANAQLKNSQKKMEKLAELKYDPNCSFCMDNVFVKDAIETKNNINSEEKTVNDIQDIIKTLEGRIKHNSIVVEIKDAKEKYDKSWRD